MADIIYHDLFRSLAEKEQDLNNTDIIKVALLSDDYTPSPDHAHWSDVSSNELSGNGYVAGGFIVTMTVADVDASNNVKFDISDPAWTAAGGQLGGDDARYGIVYNSTTNDLIYLIDFLENKTIADGKVFTIAISTTGLFVAAQT